VNLVLGFLATFGDGLSRPNKLPSSPLMEANQPPFLFPSQKEAIMSNLQSDLDTVKAGIAKMLHFSLNAPKPPATHSKQAYEELIAHQKAADKWTKEEGPKVVEAGFNVLAQFFKDISSIADGVNS
jgi:hypothetical protein